MPEAMHKEVPLSRTAHAAGDERRERPMLREREQEEFDPDLALDDTGVELDDDADEDDGEQEPPGARSGSRVRKSGAAPRRRDAEPRLGTVVAGKYRIERVIEHADSVIVVQALHLGLEQLVTLKYLLPSASAKSGAVTRFLREARTASQLESEHVARIVDVGRTRSGIPFVVTEELSGWELDEVLRVRGPLPVQEAVEYVIQACDAVAEAHGLGIVHGALNLANIVLTRRADDSPLIKVLGFGASALPERRLLGEDPASLMGTSGFTTILPYLAPEQIRSSDNLDDRVDVWALGALLHTLLAGSPPFRGKTALALLAIVSADAPRRLAEVRDDISPDLEAAIVRCLEKDRALRFANVRELALALKPFASGDAQSTVDRISRMSGRGTKPPPLPIPRTRAIVPSSRPPANAASTLPVATASRWLLIAAMAGASTGALGALFVGLSLRSQLAALAQSATPAAAMAVSPPQPVVAQPVLVAPPNPAPSAVLAKAAVAPPAPRPVPAAPVARFAVPAEVKTEPAAVGNAQPAGVRGATVASAPRSETESAKGHTARKSSKSGAPSMDLFDDTR
jgi:serine/threonine protein kinase